MKRIIALLAFLTLSCASTSQHKIRSQAAHYTKQGVAVLDPSGVIKPGSLDDTIDDVTAWWCFRYPDQCAEITKWVAGGALRAEAQDKPIVDPGYPQLGAAYGFTYVGNMRIWWNTKTNGDTFDYTLRHELAHVILYVLRGHKDIGDHAFMKQIGYPWQ